MMRTTLSLAMILALSSMAFGANPMNWEIPQGSVTVDGDLSDWSDALWDDMAALKILGPAPDPWAGADWGNAFYSAKWVPGGLYVAVKTTDTDNQFSVSGYPGTWPPTP